MVATTRGDDLMVANAVRGKETNCKNTNGARRHVFRAMHLPTGACSHFTCSPCSIICQSTKRTCEAPLPSKPDNGFAERAMDPMRVRRSPEIRVCEMVMKSAATGRRDRSMRGERRGFLLDRGLLGHCRCSGRGLVPLDRLRLARHRAGEHLVHTRDWNDVEASLDGVADLH